MWSAERVIARLRDRGELWEAAPGLIGMRGDTLGLYRALAAAVARLAAVESDDEWRTPPGIALETLARGEYFASFPQWLTAASHLSDDPAALERVATAEDPASAARDAVARPDAALPPAVCFHTYATLADSRVSSPTRMTAQATCWRHEGDRLVPLERGWAFTMREIVCLGTAADVEAFRRRGIDRAMALAHALSLDARVAEASDPFFAPTARGKALLQRIKALKQELLLPLGGGRTMAAASFNNHETFFGSVFGIGLTNGATASTACVAFGLERWLLAFLVAHGPNPAAWPTVDGRAQPAEVRP